MKSGIKTSEFWLVSIASIMIYLNQTGIIGEPMTLEQIGATTALVSSYAISRGIAKKG